MGNWRTFPLRIIRASWGIAVDIRARWALVSDVSGKEIRVSPRVYLEVTATGLLSSDVEYMVHGVGRMASALEAKTQSGLLVIEVDQLIYSPADYQPEGAEIAIICWICEEFEISSPIKDVVYNREENKYTVSYKLDGQDWATSASEARFIGPAALGDDRNCDMRPGSG